MATFILHLVMGAMLVSVLCAGAADVNLRPVIGKISTVIMYLHYSGVLRCVAHCYAGHREIRARTLHVHAV